MGLIRFAVFVRSLCCLGRVMVEGFSVSLWRKGVQLKVSEVKIQNSLGRRERGMVQVRLKPYSSRHSF